MVKNGKLFVQLSVFECFDMCSRRNNPNDPVIGHKVPLPHKLFLSITEKPMEQAHLNSEELYNL
jgi:hypothetical protein